MNPVKLALVGYGNWGKNYIAAAQEAGNAVVSHVVTHRKASSDQFVVSERLEDVLDHVDAVVIANHPIRSPELCEIALAAGKPVIIEKPAALCIADAKRIRDAEIGSCLPVLIMHQHLFSMTFEALREEVLRRPGEDRLVLSIGANFGPNRDYSPLWDYGPHDIAMLEALELGAPLSLNCSRSLLDCFHIDIEWSGAKSSTIIGNAAAHKIRSLSVQAGAWIGVYDGISNTMCTSEGQRVASYEKPLTRAVQAFAHVVREGGTADYRFGATWAQRITGVLDSSENYLRGVSI